MRGDIVVEKIPSVKNLVDSFTKISSTKIFDGHKDSLGVKCVPNMLQGLWEFVGIKPFKALLDVTD